jgi:hypothetical protein
MMVRISYSISSCVLLARQFCDCLRDRVDDFIGFIGIDFVRRGPCRIFGEEIVGVR